VRIVYVGPELRVNNKNRYSSMAPPVEWQLHTLVAVKIRLDTRAQRIIQLDRFRNVRHYVDPIRNLAEIGRSAFISRKISEWQRVAADGGTGRPVSFGLMFGFVEVAVAGVVVAATFAMTVAMIVNQQRLASDLQKSPAECLCQMFGLQNVVRCSVGNHTTSEQHHALGTLGLFEMMSREYDGRPVSDLLIDDSEYRLLAGKIKAGNRLVQQQQLR